MRFGWINGINATVIVSLLAINQLAVRKGWCGSLRSKHLPLNLLEQLGRYGCILFMVLPVLTEGWKFGFRSAEECFFWLGLTVLLLAAYVLLWLKKRKGGTGVLYGLAIVPVILFLMNGVLLRHPALIASSLLFGVCHVMIVRENAGL